MKLKHWMNDQISRAEKVIVVSDEVYADKANKRAGGVGYETDCILRDMKLHPNARKYIAVICSENIQAGMPAYLKDRYVLHCPSNAEREKIFNELVRALYDLDEPSPVRQRPIYF
jgi:hypothetical protein